MKRSIAVPQPNSKPIEILVKTSRTRLDARFLKEQEHTDVSLR